MSLPSLTSLPPNSASAQAFDASLQAALPTGSANHDGRDTAAGGTPYIGHTAEGAWHIDIDSPMSSGGAIDAAITLIRAEALLRAVDLWLEGAGLDGPDWTWLDVTDSDDRAPAHAWPPVDATPTMFAGLLPPTIDAWGGALSGLPTADPSTAASGATARWVLEDGTRGTFVAPWEALRACGPFQPGPAVASFAWEAALAVCVLDRFALEPAEVDLLEPGGAVVLPGSMGSTWGARLRASNEGGDAGLAMRVHSEPIGPAPVDPRGGDPVPAAIRVVSLPDEGADAWAAERHRGESTDADRSAVWEVRSRRPLALAVEQLCGWTTTEGLPTSMLTQLELARPGTRPDVRAARTAGETSGVMIAVMPGTLMPWGRGRALWLGGA